MPQVSENSNKADLSEEKEVKKLTHIIKKFCFSQCLDLCF